MFKIHTDSLSSNTWINGSQDAFTTYLYSPLKNITDVSIVGASFQATGTNVAYLYVEQLSTQYNETTSSSDPINTSRPDAVHKASIRGSLARFDVVSETSRTIYHQYDYDTKTIFRTPLNKLDRITVHMLDENGDSLTAVSNIFITYSFNCAQPSAQAPSRTKQVVIQRPPSRINNNNYY